MLLIPSVMGASLLQPVVVHLRALACDVYNADTGGSWLTQPMKSAIIEQAVLPPLFPCLRLAQMRFPKDMLCYGIWSGSNCSICERRSLLVEEEVTTVPSLA